jgi:carbamoyl-phosphate synthase large subunit
MNILMIGFDTGRWGSARLTKPLKAAGFRVAVLCADENPLAKTRYIERHFRLEDAQSSRRFEHSLARAMEAWNPVLVIPADERAVACLHALIRKVRSGGPSPVGEAGLLTIINSFGNPAQFDATLLKSDTLRLASQLGLRVPEGRSVSSAESAIVAAAGIGFPVYVKTSFSWAGQGVTFCRNATEVAAAVTKAQPRSWLRLRKAIKHFLHRDWYPTDSAIDVQRSIAGTPAMYCAVALHGRMIAGFAGVTQQTCAANGPSSIVWIGADAEMERVSAKMIGALCATGFIAFDFMIEESTGDIHLLECNPRPIPVCHLGSRIGVDLCVALAGALRAEVPLPPFQIDGETITLFPQEWQRNPDGIGKTGNHIDMPLDDPMLLRAMVDSYDAGAPEGLPAGGISRSPVRWFRPRASLAWR